MRWLGFCGFGCFSWLSVALRAGNLLFQSARLWANLAEFRRNAGAGDSPKRGQIQNLDCPETRSPTQDSGLWLGTDRYSSRSP